MPFVSVSRIELTGTLGDLTDGPDGTIASADREMRRVLIDDDLHPVAAKTTFTYLGITDDTDTTGGGALLEQFGLELMAANQCNLLTVMWRVASTPAGGDRVERAEVVVKVKRNEDVRDGCGNKGYWQAERWREADGVPRLGDGLPHTLVATLRPTVGGHRLAVAADTFAGDVFIPTSKLDFVGPCGVRADNARVHFRLWREEGVVDRARAFAVAAHGDQMYGDQPYSVHLDAVAAILLPFGEVAQVVGYLHDVIEDTDVSAERLRAEFGERVAKLVSFVTDEPGANRRERKARCNAKLAAVSTEDVLALVVKAADRLANLRASAAGGADSKLGMYRREHADFRQAAYRPGLCDDLWREIDTILGTKG